jgi:DNA-binding CsgD family transcriptional regulator
VFNLPAIRSDQLLVDRGAETAALVAAVAAMRSGRSAFLQVSGEPGSGKTRLLNALAELAGQVGARVVRMLSAGAGFPPYGGLHDVLDELFAGDGRGGLDRALLDRVSERLAEWADPGGGVLLIDDFHLFDGAAAGLAALLRMNVDAPFVLAIAHRPRQTDPAVLEALACDAQFGGVHRIEPSPLTEAGVSTLLSAWQDSGRPSEDPAFARKLCAAARGNPGHVRILAAAGWQPQDWPDSPGPNRDGLLRAATPLVAEISALPPDAQTAAAAAAVLGETFCPRDVAVLTGEDPQRTLASLALLARADVVRPVSSGGRLAFRHAVLRHVIHQNADPSYRLLWHRKAFDLLSARGAPPVVLAGHAEYIAGSDSAASLSTLIVGAAEVAHVSPSRAARWLLLVAESLPADWTGPDRATLLIAACRALIAAGQLSRARALAHDMLRDAPTLGTALRLETHAVCTEAERHLGHYQEADAIAEVGLRLVPDPLPDPLPAEAAELIMSFGMTHAQRGTHEQARALVAQAATVDVAPGRVSRAALSVLDAFYNTYLGELEPARTQVTRIARLMDASPDADARDAPEVLATLGCAELYLERIDDASRHLRRGLDEGSGGAKRHTRLHHLLGLALVDQWRGRLAESERWAREVEDLARAIGAADVVGVAMTLRAAAVLPTRSRRDAAEVVALAERGIDSTLPGQGWWASSAAGLLAQIQFMTDDAAGCLRTLRERGGPGLSRLQPPFRPSMLAVMVQAALRTGDTESADRYLLDAQADAARLGLPVQEAHVRRAEAVLLTSRGQHDKAAALFGDAAQTFRQAGMPLQYAWTLIRATPSFAEALGRDAALEFLETAAAEGERTGATRVCEDAELAGAALLGEDADPPPREASTRGGKDPLSSRERQIAELAATGMRSRQIAEQLFLSPRTVDTHLTRVYRKMNVSSRTELARLLYQESE